MSTALAASDSRSRINQRRSRAYERPAAPRSDLARAHRASGRKERARVWARRNSRLSEESTEARSRAPHRRRRLPSAREPGDGAEMRCAGRSGPRTNSTKSRHSPLPRGRAREHEGSGSDENARRRETQAKISLPLPPYACKVRTEAEKQGLGDGASVRVSNQATRTSVVNSVVKHREQSSRQQSTPRRTSSTNGRLRIDVPVCTGAAGPQGRPTERRVVDRCRIARRSPQFAVDLAVAEVDGQHRRPAAQGDGLGGKTTRCRARVAAPAGADERVSGAGRRRKPVQRRDLGPTSWLGTEDAVVADGDGARHQFDQVQRGAVERDRPEPRLGAGASRPCPVNAASRATRCAPEDCPMSTTRDPSPPHDVAFACTKASAVPRLPSGRAGWAAAPSGSSARRRCSRGAASASPCSRPHRDCSCRRTSRPRRGPSAGSARVFAVPGDVNVELLRRRRP